MTRKELSEAIEDARVRLDAAIQDENMRLELGRGDEEGDYLSHATIAAHAEWAALDSRRRPRR